MGLIPNIKIDHEKSGDKYALIWISPGWVVEFDGVTGETKTRKP